MPGEGTSRGATEKSIAPLFFWASVPLLAFSSTQLGGRRVNQQDIQKRPGSEFQSSYFRNLVTVRAP